MRLRVAFLNCHNLFPAGVSPRGPQTEAELTTRVDAVVGAVQALFPGETPHLLGLCEVGDEAPAERVRAALGLTAPLIWSGPPPANPQSGAQTGLMIMHDPGAVALAPAPIALGQVSALERQKWMGALFQLAAGSQGAFWFVVNHWKSNLGGTNQTDTDRMRSARELGEFYLGTARMQTEAMLLVGDFNCEPGGRPLHEQKEASSDPPNALRAVRERALVLRDGNRLAYFYNPMWRFMGEPDHYEVAAVPGYVAPRLIGSHCGNVNKGTDWNLWDHLMVTKPVLLGPALRLVEATVRILRVPPDASDHCAVAAEFEY